jgi:hypothetical protein
MANLTDWIKTNRGISKQGPEGVNGNLYLPIFDWENGIWFTGNERHKKWEWENPNAIIKTVGHFRVK